MHPSHADTGAGAIRLAYWPSPYVDGDYSPATGTVRRRFLPRGRASSRRYPGFFSIERTRFGRRIVVALYLDARGLWLQAGTRAWELPSPGLSLSFERRGACSSRFVVEEDGVPAWRVDYVHPLRTALARIDPTYDAIDVEADHFLCFVADNALRPDWQANARIAWSSGSAPQ